jgi:hypothetical protein
MKYAKKHLFVLEWCGHTQTTTLCGPLPVTKKFMQSRVAQWLRALYCIASCATRDSVRGATHNWPSVVRVREGLDGRDVLVSSRTSDSCAR